METHRTAFFNFLESTIYRIVILKEIRARFFVSLQNAWESHGYKANIGPGTNKQDLDQPAYPRCQNLVCLHQLSMNSENVDTEPSLQMHKLPCAPPPPPLFFFWGGGGGEGAVYTLRKGQHSW